MVGRLNSVSPLGGKVDVSELAIGTDGELLTWDSDGNPTTVSVGTSGQVLTSNGAGSAPTFQAIAGGWTKIEEATPSGASSVQFATISGYKYLRMVGQLAGSVNGGTINFQLNGDTDSEYGGTYLATTTFTSYNATSSIRLGGGDGSNEAHVMFDVLIPVDYDLGSLNRLPVAMMCMSESLGFSRGIDGYYFAPGADITQIDIIPSSGTLTGTVTLYGLEDA